LHWMVSYPRSRISWELSAWISNKDPKSIILAGFSSHACWAMYT
jgi:hypothetical protein